VGASACFDERTLLAYLAGLCDVELSARIQRHADGCLSCRRRLASLAHAHPEQTTRAPIETTGGAAALTVPVGRQEAEDDDDELRDGMTLGRYQIAERLGQGGMGAVHRAFDTLLRRNVGLKVLRADKGGSSSDEELMQTVLREARAACQLTHPNIVSIYDVGESDGISYIVMELVEGYRLLDVARGKVEATVEQKIAWLLQLAQALSAVHRAGLVHRDVKPGNVMVTHIGQAKLLDFGIARVHRHPLQGGPASVRGPDAMTQGALVGTPAYMAPEQWLEQPATARSDQYAWALVAFELLSGMRASNFGGAEQGHTLPSLNITNPDVDLSQLDVVLARALSNKPFDRYDDLDQLLVALSEATSQFRISIAPHSNPTSSGAGSTGNKQRMAAIDSTEHMSQPIELAIESQPTADSVTSGDARPSGEALPFRPSEAPAPASLDPAPTSLVPPPSSLAPETMRSQASGDRTVVVARWIAVAALVLVLGGFAAYAAFRSDGPAQPSNAMLSTPKSPRKRVAPVAFIDKARHMAQAKWPDAQLAGMHAYPVARDGTVDFEATSVAAVHYSFLSPQCCSDAQPPNPKAPCWFRVSLTSHETIVRAGDPPSSKNLSCASPTTETPKCSLPALWKVALELGSPPAVEYARIDFGRPKGRELDWLFVADGTGFWRELVDDCVGGSGPTARPKESAPAVEASATVAAPIAASSAAPSARPAPAPRPSKPAARPKSPPPPRDPAPRSNWGYE
jgi:serine/threonine protein kinase